jgi:hypothetical protein
LLSTVLTTQNIVPLWLLLTYTWEESVYVKFVLTDQVVCNWPAASTFMSTSAPWCTPSSKNILIFTSLLQPLWIRPLSLICLNSELLNVWSRPVTGLCGLGTGPLQETEQIQILADIINIQSKLFVLWKYVHYFPAFWNLIFTTFFEVCWIKLLPKCTVFHVFNSRIHQDPLHLHTHNSYNRNHSSA